MEKIHIGFLIDRFGIGGTENQLQLLINGLDRSKYKVSLFLLRHSNGYLEFEKHTNVIILEIHSILKYQSILKIIKLAKIFKKEKVHILQTFMQDATIVGILAAKLGRINRIVVSIEDMQFWATSLSLAVHRLVTFFADSIRVNSFAIKENIKKKYIFNDIHVIHNGIQTNQCIKKTKEFKRKLEREVGIDKDIPVITLVANCNRTIKRVDLFIEAAHAFLKVRQACFLVVGDGHLRKQLEDRVYELGIQRHVKFLGQRADVADIYAGSDIAVNASDSEGLSNAVLEGMGAGLPVIASDIPGNREVVINYETGLLFAPGDKDDFAEKMLKLFDHEELKRKMGDNACKIVLKEFDVSNMVRRHGEYFVALIGKH
jgi:L-malate glycosyltransferase